MQKSHKTQAFSLLFSILAVGLFFPLTALAKPNLNVAYVDLQRALSTSKKGIKAQKEYEEEVKGVQANLDKKKKEYEKLQSDFNKQKDSLNKKALADKGEKILKLEKDLKRSFQDAQENLRRKNSQLVAELYKEIRKIVEGVGKEKGFTMIFEKNNMGVLYADNQIDITDAVVEKFNKQAK